MDLSPTQSEPGDATVTNPAGGGTVGGGSSGDENDNAHVEILSHNLVAGATNNSRQLELELARTKLALVESECRNQDLMHRLAGAGGAPSGGGGGNNVTLGAGKWLRRTLTTIKDATRNAQPAYPPPAQALSYLQ